MTSWTFTLIMLLSLENDCKNLQVERKVAHFNVVLNIVNSFFRAVWSGTSIYFHHPGSAFRGLQTNHQWHFKWHKSSVHNGASRYWMSFVSIPIYYISKTKYFLMYVVLFTKHKKKHLCTNSKSCHIVLFCCMFTQQAIIRLIEKCDISYPENK